MRSLAGAVVLIAALSTLLVSLRFCQRRFQLRPEVVRKLFHMGGGIICLTLPWLLTESWLVVTMTGLITAALILLQQVPALRAGLGRVLGSVDRLSLGELYFPLSVCIIYVLSDRDRVVYSVPILILTFADAVAALVGARYGLVRYRTSDGLKSVEGSVAFFLAAFFSTHVPILLCSRTGRAESLLIALIMGLLIMMLEAISWAGLDNLFVPIMSFLLLKALFSLTVGELALRLLFTAMLATLVLVGGRRTGLNTDARLGAILIGHFIWMAGDWRWFLMPVLLFVSYRALAPSPEWDKRRVLNVHVVLWVCSAGLAWLFLGRVFHQPQLLYPFTLSFAANLAIIGIVREQFNRPERRFSLIVLNQVAKSWLVLLFSYAIIEWVKQGWTAHLAIELCLALAAVLVAALAFCLAAQASKELGMHPRRWIYQATAAGLASCLGVLPSAPAWIAKMQN